MLEDKKDGWKAAIALAPAMIFLIVFMFFPLVNTTIMSFMEGFQFRANAGIFAISHRYQGIGFQEYINVLRDPIFLTALKNTMVMVVISVPISVILGLLVSVCLNNIKRLQNIFQTIFFLPYVTNTIALGMVFKVMFSTNNGLINLIVETFGGDKIAWLTDATTKGYWSALFVITCYTVWSGLAFKILVFLSGLQSIDKQYYEAARIDGASRARIFWKITVPLLSPMIAYITITSFIGAFKAYESVIAVFGRGSYVFGPAGDTNMWITVVGYVYKLLPSLMTPGNLSKASAGSVILLLIILAFTAIQLYVSKKKVHY
ncbi:MAG: sugar ABC transporter permease [Bacilli bacterium]|nr:sugar ABC transporter permease [Bacilli bacterium]